VKLRITLKSPDAIHDSIEQAIEAELPDDLVKEERKLAADELRGEIEEAIQKWIAYREYLTVEIDIDAGTAVVCAQ
jgi:hypothetical protein